MNPGISRVLGKARATGIILALLAFSIFSHPPAAAQNFWQPTSLSTGLISSLASNARGDIFAGNSLADIFRSNDNGENWTQVADLRAGVWNFAFNNSGDIFAATVGAGVYRSTDNGNNWVQVNAGLTNQVAWSLAINVSGHVFAGTDSGLVFRSTDNGDSWVQITDLGNNSVLALAINAGGHVFAGTTGDGVFRSVDNGNSWSNVNSGLLDLNVTSLAIHKNGTIFAGVFRDEIYRSTDNGDTWGISFEGPSSETDWSLAFNASGHVFAGTFGEGVLRSTDNGDIWTPINTGLTNTDVAALAVNNFTGHIFAGTNGAGVFRSAASTLGDYFSRITTGAIVTDVFQAVGCSWADYDNDGDLDLFVTNFTDNGPNFLYRNDGVAGFIRITQGDLVNEAGASSGSSWADYDNDGLLDLFVANQGSQRNFLYHNDGNGVFTKITAGPIVEDVASSATGSWGDYDHDGFVDLFVANVDGNNFLYHNEGNGAFTKITAGVIVNDGGASRTADWVDFDNDGHLDLFVANQSNQANFLYRNLGDGAFGKITSGAIVTDATDSRGSAWGDFDNDGDFDLFVGNQSNQNDLLYRNEGGGNFTKITTGPVVTGGGDSEGGSWADFDNDGDLDLFVTNLSSGRNALYQNDGQGSFTPITNSVVNDNIGGSAVGNAWGDYDNDGDLDLFVTNANASNLLYRNELGNLRSWINLTCVGAVSNGAAIGAKVRVKATINNRPTWQLQQISAQPTYLSQNSLNAEFGLGNAASIDSIRVEWPSGLLTNLANIGVNQFLTITEPDNRPPFLSHAIPDTATTVDGPIIVLNLDDFFTDPDGDLLVYAAASSEEIIATTSVRDSLLKIVPRTLGSTIVTVTANDGVIGSDSTSFVLTVRESGQAQAVVKIYWTDPDRGSIFRANSDGTAVEVIADSLANPPLALALDISSGKIYWTEFINTTPRVRWADLDGAEQQIWRDPSGLVGMPAITLDSINGKVYWIEQPTFSAQSAVARAIGSILRANRDGSNLEIFLGNPYDPFGLAWGGDKIYWADASDQILRANLDGSVDPDFFIEFPAAFPNPLAVDVSAGKIYWAADGSIWRSDLDGLEIEELIPRIDFPEALTLDVTNGQIYWSLLPGHGTPGVFRSNLDGTHVEALAIPGLTSAAGIGVDGNNHPPVLTQSLPDTTISISLPELVLDLAQFFIDPDGDALRFTGAASNEQIVTATVDGSELFVRPLALGSTLVRVIASEVRGGADTTFFQVTVTGANSPPIVVNAIPDVTLSASAPPFQLVIDLSNVFIDPDEDELTYTAFSSDSTVATAKVAGIVLTVIPGKSGTATVTVTAEDFLGARVSDTFQVVTVSAGAGPSIDNPLPDTTLVLASGVFIRDLEAPPKVFSDTTAGGLLRYSASSSNRNVAEAQIRAGESVLRVTPRRIGAALITVTATNSNNLPSTDNFIVTVTLSKPPVITNLSPISAPWGTDVVIAATIIDDRDTLATRLPTATLSYRVASDSAFTSITMPVDATNFMRFTATIPGNMVTTRGVEYFITAADRDSIPSVSRSPNAGISSIAVRLTSQEGIVKPTPQPGGDQMNTYRLVSVPIRLVNPDALAILQDDLGQYDPKQWRVFDWGPGVSPPRMEPPGSSLAMVPGKALWLITREPRTIDTGPGEGESVHTREPYAVPLQLEWNLIGNPFNFPIPVQNLRLNKRNIADPDSLELIRFNGSWDSTAVLMLEPFEGYALEIERSDTLYIDPIIHPPQSRLGKFMTVSTKSQVTWSIRIFAEARSARDLATVAGISPAASFGWDRMDRPEPPGVGEYVSVYFPHSEWGRLSQRYRTDYRPESAEGHEWEFEVETNVRDEVHLTFAEVEGVPAEYEVWLVDKSLQLSRNLRENNTYSVAGRGPNHPKTLTLVVSKRDQFDERYSEFQRVPETFELFQNFPNPFNPATTIQYALPRAERVTIKVFDLLGKVIATLADHEQREAGYHVAIWNGRNAAGRAVGNGVYFVQMRAGGFVQTRKMVLVE